MNEGGAVSTGAAYIEASMSSNATSLPSGPAGSL